MLHNLFDFDCHIKNNNNRNFICVKPIKSLISDTWRWAMIQFFCWRTEELSNTWLCEKLPLRWVTIVDWCSEVQMSFSLNQNAICLKAGLESVSSQKCEISHSRCSSLSLSENRNHRWNISSRQLTSGVCLHTRRKGIRNDLKEQSGSHPS